MVTGYSFPFHVHILHIWYGTVLANTTVLCMEYVAPPGECYYNTLLRCDDYFSFVVCGIACFPCAMQVIKVWASFSSPRLPLWQISFLLEPPLLS